MRSLIFLCVGLSANLVSATSSLSEHRFVFEFPESAGTIRKMQIDVTQSKNVWMAKTVSLSGKGEKKTSQLICSKPAEELNCHHEDGGGGFKLILEPTPRLTIGDFKVDDPDDEPAFYLKAPKDGSLVIEGKKSALSSTDAI